MDRPDRPAHEAGRDDVPDLETDDSCSAWPGNGSATYHHVRVNLPGGDAIRVVAPKVGLDGACGILGSEFYDAEAPQSPPGPIQQLKASITAPAVVAVGDTLTYIVTLTNPTDQEISLQPCPSYEESLASRCECRRPTSRRAGSPLQWTLIIGKTSAAKTTAQLTVQ